MGTTYETVKNSSSDYSNDEEVTNIQHSRKRLVRIKKKVQQKRENSMINGHEDVGHSASGDKTT